MNESLEVYMYMSISRHDVIERMQKRKSYREFLNGCECKDQERKKQLRL
jgi:hypothetical protein